MNAQTKHTPGPWKELDYGSEVMIVVSGHHIASVPLGCAMDEQEDRANARLIAAAPELLEALKEANQHLAVVGFPRDSRGKYDKHGEWGFGEAMPNEADAAEVKNAFVAIRAAIAKAGTP